MQGLLFLSSKGMRAYSWRKGELTFEKGFAEIRDLEFFKSYLNSRRSVPFRLLIDLPDESFRLETIPPARGSDRRAIIERRLAQVANTTPYTCAVSLGKLSGGRGNEVLMLATLTRPAHISPWLDLCCETGTLIQEITSPPFLLNRLTKSLGLHQGRHLLFTHGAGGLRQSYFDAGQLQFSRLTTDNLPRGATSTICFEEANKVRHYFGGSLKSAADAQFHVLLAPKEIPAFQARCMAEGEVLMHAVDLSDLEADHGVPVGQSDDSRCDALLLHLMAKGLSTAHFGPAPVLRPYRLWQRQRKLKIFNSAVFGSCLISAMAYGLHAWLLSTEAKIQEHRNRESRQQYQALLQTLPSMPAPANEVRGVNASMRALQRESLLPEATYRLLSHALDQVPEVELDRIEWRVVTSAEHGGPSPAKLSRTIAIANIDLHATNAGAEGDRNLGAIETLATTLRQYPDTGIEIIPADTNLSTPPQEERLSLRMIHGGR